MRSQTPFTVRLVIRFAESLFLLLFYAYPSNLRREVGDEMCWTFRRRLEQAGGRGVLAILQLMLWELAGAGSSLEQRLRHCFEPQHPTVSATSGASAMDTLRQDLTFACRSLARRPSFTLLAVLALALGIGANTAIFSVLEAVVLRPLSFHRPERLVALYETNPERGWQRAQVAGANYLDWQEQARSFEVLAAHNDWLNELTLTGDGDPEVLRANGVTGNFFECLGVTPALGRSFTAEESWAPDHLVAVLSDGLWRRRFGSDPGIVDRTVLLDGEQHTVVGVMPRCRACTRPRSTDRWSSSPSP